MLLDKFATTLCYAIMLPGCESAFRAGFWPDCYQESTEICPPAGLRLAGGPISVPVAVRPKSGPEGGPEALLGYIEYVLTNQVVTVGRTLMLEFGR